MRRAGTVLAAIVLVLAACSDERALPPPSLADNPEAAAVAVALDADVTGLGQKQAEARRSAELAFGPRLERDLAACRGTRYENKPLYLLAQWLLAHGGDDAPPQVISHLDRLDSLPAVAYRRYGRVLRVQALLRLGRLDEARELAIAMDREIPESGILAQVAFHELVGTPAPDLPGIATGGEHAVDGPLLVAFLSSSDANADEWMAQWTAVKGLRICAVVASGDLLAAGAAASRWGCDVRWLKPDDRTWVAAWKVPIAPSAVLLGPGSPRLILAVDPRPRQVAAALAPPR